MKKIIMYLLGLVMLTSLNCSKKERSVWSIDQANDWYAKQGWIRGCNFIPSTAINQLEMWQAETFDTATIRKELTWAANIGMNTMRVYLHHLVWKIDPSGFKERINQFLSIANNLGIKIIFVIFDDCWNATYKAGKQPDPKIGVHNSGWVRDPGDSLFLNPLMIDDLECYVKDILKTFSNDERILLWDLYNEPGNSGYGNASMLLLMKVFTWAREVNPKQPLSSGVWNYSLKDLNKFQIENSDIITYHNYDNDSIHKIAIDSLKKYGKPLICTEYMARTRGSKFENIMPLLKKENIGAINWGLVAGKTNTIYEWSKPISDGSEPAIWFHDIFRKDGTPYDENEVNLIKTLTGKN